MSDHVTLPILADTGYVVLDPATPVDPSEWHGLEYVSWRSAGITRFAPLASFAGEIDCNGFWNLTPPRTDKDGVWVPSQVDTAPTLARRAQEPAANVGRCRVVELQPNSYPDAVYNLHRDDNNRLNPPGAGWVVRGLENLTDDADSLLVLRKDRADPATETRIPLPVGTRVILDSQRLWHAVWHRGTAPRYALVTSWECGPELAAYIAAAHGAARVASTPLAPDVITGAQAEVARRIEERREALAAVGRAFEDPPQHGA